MEGHLRTNGTANVCVAGLEVDKRVSQTVGVRGVQRILLTGRLFFEQLIPLSDLGCDPRLDLAFQPC
jgi:hypothetical protein